MRSHANHELVVGNILRDQAAAHPNRVFLKFTGGELTYGDVDRAADHHARGLADRGIGQGDHVAVMLPNGPELLHVVFALARLGAVAVPVNTAYKGDILRHVLSSSDATALVVDEAYVDVAAPEVERVPAVRGVVVRGARARGLTAPVATLDELAGARGEPPRPRVRHCDTQAIMYTSGTTGPSKGAIVPHALALIDAQDSLRYLAYEPGETIYCPLPLFHAAALWDGVFVALLAGADIAIVDRFSASRFWSDVRRFRAHVAMGIFSMVPILMSAPPTPADKDHPLRALYVGKSFQDDELHARFGVRAVETYTSTEIGIGTGSPYGQWRAGSCGEVNTATHDVRIVDDLDREVAPGVHGQIVVRPRRPFAITPGYYNAPQATADCFRNLWFHTGDIAYRDDDGYFYFVERIKDSIRRRGENISAFDVERAVNTHPAVLESAAFAVPADDEEDEVKVAVVLRRGAELPFDELIEHCAGRLPGFMVPRYLELVDELPRSAIGKLAKHELRARGDHGITPGTWDRQAKRSGARA